MFNPSVSVIICTLNRGHFLRRVMAAISACRSSFQELIVVVGPVEDDSHSILADYETAITHILHTNQKNVSVARNLGLKAATQDILLYLDDDVIPSADWIVSHIKAHRRKGDRCGCVTGAVADRTQSTPQLQFSRGIFNKLSTSHPVLSSAKEKRYLAHSQWFPGAMGANASYKRLALLKIGGFDEFYEYFLEETDICLRLFEAGYSINRVNHTVDHYVQPSHNRCDRRHLTCWYALAKNTTYFALKHGDPHCYKSPWFLLRLARLLSYRCLLRILRLKVTHRLPNRLLLQYLGDSVNGIRTGWQAGKKAHSVKLHPLPIFPQHLSEGELEIQ